MRTLNAMVAAVVCLSAAVGIPTTAHAQFEELLKKVPSFSNALVVIDVAGVKKAPLAIKEKWADSHEQAYAARPVFLPPEADKIVLASHLSPHAELQADWELAVMSLTAPMSMKAIARAEGGYVDSINGLQAAWTPSNSYFVSLDDKTLGMMFPANRQHVGRWADFARQNSEIVASKYLRDAAYSVGPAGQIILAFDLRNMPQPHRTKEALVNSKALEGKNADVDGLVGVIESIQGVALGIDVGETARGKVRVDFGENVALLKPFAKPLLLEAMAKWGAMIEDFDNWKVEVGDTYITLEGELSSSGMRRIFSILEVPTTKFSSLADQTSSGQPPPEEPSQSLMAQSSLTYYKTVDTMIQDLRKDLSTSFQDGHAVWMERFGRKIDRLPILNVDQELLQFGSDVAVSFRNMALARRGAGLETGVRNASVYTEYYSGGGGYNGGGGYYSNNQSESRVKTQIRLQENQKAQEVRFTGWKQIEDTQAKVRKDMTEKYQVEF